MITSITKSHTKYQSHPIYCEFCGKSYKTVINLNKHIILCEVINRNNPKIKPKTNSNSNTNTPSQEDMYKIIEMLTLKYTKLEEKMDQLQKWVDKKKKKINIIDWLNENEKIKSTSDFDCINDKLNITQKSIDLLFINNFYDTVREILTNYYNQKQENQNQENQIPLFAFNQKANLIYVYHQCSWKELSKDQLVDFLDKIQIKITKCLKEWKKINEDKVRNDNKYSEIYSKTLIKIMDIKFNNETIISRYKSLLYNKIKVDMKNLIEYEYEF